MYKIRTTLLLCLIGLVANAQNYSIRWGEALKMKKGTTDLEIVHADNTGYYFLEDKLSAGGFGPFVRVKTQYVLKKFDKNFEQVYSESYKDELKGLELLNFQSLDNELFTFATDYSKKEKTYTVYGAKVNTSDGKLQGEFMDLGSYELESKKDDFQARLSAINNNQQLLLVCDISSKDDTRLGITVLDKNLRRQAGTSITLTFAPGFYSLEDVKLINNTIVVLGKSFEEVEWKRKRKKKVFKKFELGLYTLNGTKLKDISLDITNKFTLEGRLLELAGNQVALAGLYTNDPKKKNLNGFFVDKIDLNTGTLIESSSKEISENMIGNNFVDDTGEDEEDDSDKKKKDKKDKNEKDDKDDDEISNQFKIKDILINPLDSSFVITAEVSDLRSYTTTYTSGGGSFGPRTTDITTYYVFTKRDILVICADNRGTIKWLNAVPKKQLEEVSRTGYGSFGLSVYTDFAGFFATGGGMPYHSSFASSIIKNKLVLLFNDHQANGVMAKYGDKVKAIANFRKKGELFALDFDLSTGKASKKSISACADDDVITMPRHSKVIGNTFIIPAWRQKKLGKTTFKLAEVTVK